MTNKFYIIFLTIFFSFFIGLFARAEISQLTITNIDTTHHNYAFQKLGTGFTDYVVAFYAKYTTNGNQCNTSSGFPEIKLVECPDDTYTTCTTKLDFIKTTAICDSDDILYFKNGINTTPEYPSTNTEYQMLSNKYYYIIVLSHAGFGNVDLNFSGATGGFQTWTPPLTAECDTFGTSCSFDYLYFRILNATDVYQVNSVVSRLTPKTGDIDLDNNVQFTGFYSNSAYDRLIISIYNRDLKKQENTLIHNASIGMLFPYVFDTYLNNGNYSYKAFLFNYSTGSSSPEFYNQPSNYFTVGTTTMPLTAFQCQTSPDISEATLCAGIATSTSMTDIHFLGDIECSLKKSFAWAFYPDCTALNSFSLSYAELKKAFPFNAYFGLTDVLTATATTTIATTTGTLKIPFITATGTFYMLPVLASSSMPKLIGSSNYNLFRNSISWILWLAVAFLVFITFKKI
jgi:hypothetical protein